MASGSASLLLAAAGLAAVALLPPVQAEGAGDTDGHVDLAVIDSESFTDLNIANGDDTWLIEFYSDMCGSCKQFKPIFIELADKFPGIKSGACNIDTPQGMALANELNVLAGGIPHISLWGKQAQIFEAAEEHDIIDGTMQGKPRRTVDTGRYQYVPIMVGEPQKLGPLMMTVIDRLHRMGVHGH